jgi:hypothetical protein
MQFDLTYPICFALMREKACQQPAKALNSGRNRKCPPNGKPIAFEIIFDTA